MPTSIHELLDETDALVVFHLLLDAFNEVQVQTQVLAGYEHQVRVVMMRGQILLADALLARVWPLIDQGRIGPGAHEFRRAVAVTAASIRERYGITGEA